MIVLPSGKARCILKASDLNSFSELDLIEPLQRALADENYTTPTPIQSKAIGPLLQGRDLLGIAQTGTGKTAAFALPILQRLRESNRPRTPRSPRALILTPTRELAVQVADSFAVYGRHLPLTLAVIFGGVGQGPQVNAMARGRDILVATPGRLLDLMDQGYVRLNQVEVFVLDEADRMLDMGFIQPIRKIAETLPKERQTLMFSATMPDEIAKLAATLLSDPVRVEVAPVAATADRIDQHVFMVDRADKRRLLGAVLRKDAVDRAIVFTRTKHGADKLVRALESDKISSEAIHGNKSQNARQRALENFREGRTRVLVATDIAARGIDIDGVTHVINFDLPNDAESYVHRIGRTARAGAAGVALSFCDPEERGQLRDIERLIKRRLPVANMDQFRAAA